MRRALLMLAVFPAFALGPIAGANEAVTVRPVMTQGLSGADIDALLIRADAALEAGRYMSAHAAYQRAHFEDKTKARSGMGLAQSLLAMKRYAEALQYFSALPPGAQSYAGLTLCRAALGTAGDIEVELNAALEINLTDTRLWIALGHFYDGKGRSLEAQSTYVQALKYGADHAVIVNSLGLSLVQAGRFDAGLEKFQQANALAPGAEIFDNNRRMTLALKGDYDGAVLSLNEGRAARLYNDAGVIALRAGKADIAKRLFTRSLDVSPVYFAPAQANLDALAP